MTGDRRVAQPHTRHPDQLANEEVSGQHEPAGPMPRVFLLLFLLLRLYPALRGYVRGSRGFREDRRWA